MLLIALVAAVLGGSAAGEEQLSDLKARMNKVQADLDASAARITEIHATEEELDTRLKSIGAEMKHLAKRNKKLQKKAVARAAELYKSGDSTVVDILLGSEDIAELSDQAEILSQISMGDNGVFIELARATDRFEALEVELKEKSVELAEIRAEMKKEADRLQAQFASVSGEYKELQTKLAQTRQVTRPAGGSAAPAVQTASLPSTGGMYCPVGGATSFVDSWGDARSGGRSHQGVDMMAARGTPQVAITSGTITYAGYSSLGGNVQYLSGDDGNLYVYVHQDSNTVTSGHVNAGQQISVVGDTGNAAGNPHLHFEYHPGGGAAVNPYPLVRSLC
ncbi:MAG: murein hydrolase activator EnvC family protein [Actinomycetota bacterium]